MVCLLFLAILQLGFSCLQLSRQPADICADVMLMKVSVYTTNLMKKCFEISDCCWSAADGCKKCIDMKISRSSFTDCALKNQFDCKATKYCCLDAFSSQSNHPACKNDQSTDGNLCTPTINGIQGAGFCYNAFCKEMNNCNNNCGCFCGYDQTNCVHSPCYSLSSGSQNAYSCCKYNSQCVATSSPMGSCFPCLGAQIDIFCF